MITFKNAIIKHIHWRSTKEYCLKLGLRKYYKNYNWKRQSYTFLISQYLMYNGNSYNYKRDKLYKCIG